MMASPRWCREPLDRGRSPVEATHADPGAPDGTIWKVATSAKKNTGPATRRINEIVLLLGVADVAASKRFYVEQGLEVGKSFGRVYVEFAAGSSPVKLALYRRKALAKDAGVTPEARARTGSRSAAAADRSPTRTASPGKPRTGTDRRIAGQATPAAMAAISSPSAESPPSSHANAPPSPARRTYAILVSIVSGVS
jgi:hypothetical protein